MSSPEDQHNGEPKPGSWRRAPRYRRGEPVIEENRFKRSTSDWRIALRIARRSVLRTLGTSAVVVSMVALPVAGFSAVALVGESATPTADERIAAELGHTEAQLLALYAPNPSLVQDAYDPWQVTYDTDDSGQPLFEDPGAVPVDPKDLFPAGTRMITLTEAAATAETAGGRGQLAVVVGPVWDEAFTGRFEITAGSAPADPDDIMVTGAALERLGAAVGSEVTLLEPEKTTVSIAGVIDDAMYQDDYEGLYFPSSLWPGSDADSHSTTWYLPDTVIDRSELSRLNAQGVTALSRAVLTGASAVDLAANGSFWLQYGVLLFLAAAFAVFEIILLAGAAFAVGARKQQRTLATVASVGGGRRILYRIVTAQGLVLGLVGGLAGVAVGLPAGAIFMAATHDGSATQYWGFHLNPLVMTIIVLLAAVVGLLSAIAPARAATQFDVLAALRGSRKPTPANRTAPRVGVVLMIVGAALTLGGAVVLRIFTASGFWEPNALYWVGLAALVSGPILAEIGIIKCGALVLRTITRLIPRRLGLGARLAARDSAANPSRAVPAFAAIMVTAFIGVIVINVAATANRANELNYAHQVAPGEIRVWIPQDEDGAQSADPDDLTDALASVVDLDRSAVISAAQQVWGPDGVTAEATPWPSIPAENICPSNPLSSDYDAEIFDDPSTSAGYSAAVQDLATDWRCAPDNYYLFGMGDSPIIVAPDADALALILGRTPSRAALDALASGGAVALWPDYVTDDEVTISWWPEDAVSEVHGDELTVASAKALSSDVLPAVVERPVKRLQLGLVISPDTAQRLGILTEETFVLASPTAHPSQTELDAAESALESLGTSAYLEEGPQDGAMIWILGALGLCGILFLGASAVAIGLARADGRQDDATLTAVGATRMLRRNFAFTQAVIIVGLGAVTGTLAGLLTTYAISLMDTRGTWTFLPPWPALALLVVGLPLLIAAGSWLVASRPTTLAHRMSYG